MFLTIKEDSRAITQKSKINDSENHLFFALETIHFTENANVQYLKLVKNKYIMNLEYF